MGSERVRGWEPIEQKEFGLLTASQSRAAHEPGFYFKKRKEKTYIFKLH